MILLKAKFKPLVLQLATVAIASMIIVSCGSSGGAGSEPIQSENSGEQPIGTDLPGGAEVNTLADATWKLGDAVFITDFNGGATIQNNRGDNVLIVVGDQIFDTSNGDYSGSVLRITLSLSGSGDYVVTDAINATAAFGSGANVASIEVIAGTTSQNATRWDSTVTSGTLTVSVNADGRYFVSTTEPIIVTRAFDSGTGGVAGSPDNILLEMQNINANPV